MELRYPGNWKPSGQGSAFSLFPDGGVVTDARKQQSLAYGAMVNLAGVRDDNVALQDATDLLIQSMSQRNPNLRVERQREDYALTEDAVRPGTGTRRASPGEEVLSPVAGVHVFGPVRSAGRPGGDVRGPG